MAIDALDDAKFWKLPAQAPGEFRRTVFRIVIYQYHFISDSLKRGSQRLQHRNHVAAFIERRKNNSQLRHSLMGICLELPRNTHQ